jgi:hypothetical protein
LARGRLPVLLRSKTLRTSQNQTEGKTDGTNPRYGFVEQPWVRPFAEFLTTAEQHAIPKPLELKGVDG